MLHLHRIVVVAATAADGGRGSVGVEVTRGVVERAPVAVSFSLPWAMGMRKSRPASLPSPSRRHTLLDTCTLQTDTSLRAFNIRP